MTTKTYRAQFFTAADYAVCTFEAATPEQALEFARRFYDEDIVELDFRSYADNAGLDQIEVWDQRPALVPHGKATTIACATPLRTRRWTTSLTSCTTSAAAAVKATSGLPWSRRERRSPRPGQ